MTMNNSDLTRPDYKCAAHKAMLPDLQLVRDLAGGTRKMRDASTTYLPAFAKEKPPEYAGKLNRAILFNAYARTRGALVGMVFKENPKLQADIPPLIQSHLENIDLAGTHIDVFAKELFVDAFEGHVFILTDYPRRLTRSITSLSPTPTALDDLVLGRRPYWVKFKKDQAINWRSARINGAETLTQITFETKGYEASGLYGEELVTRYLVYRLPVDEFGQPGFVEWELFRKNSERGGDEITRETGDVTGLRRIPVVTIYGKRTGFLESVPPLLDLAFLNVGHWQELADYKTQLRYLVPILLRLGMPEDLINKTKDLTIGPGALADQPKDTDLKYVSHDGKALEATRQSILDIEQRMAVLGLSMLSQKSDPSITATEKRLDWVQETSDLSTMARSLQDGLEAALGFHAQYLGLKGGSIKLGVPDRDLYLDGSMIAALSDLVVKQQMTITTFYDLMARGFPGVEFSEELRKLKAGSESGFLEQGINSDAIAGVQ